MRSSAVQKSLDSIVVLGSANTDMTIKVPRLPRAGETILGGNFASSAGGKGANQAVSAARAGGNVTFIARVGNDIFGTRALSGFVAEGINVNHIIRDKKSASGVALIFVGHKGQNSIAVASGANGNLSPADVKKAGAAFQKAKIFLAQLETPLKAVEAAVNLAAANGLKVVLNPAPAQTLPARLLAKIDILTPNENEAAMLTGVPVHDEKGAAKAADRLLACGVRSVIITLGHRGAFLATRDFKKLIPAYKTRPVDTTAAGDVFNGALTVALAEDLSLLQAAKFANAAAAISVSHPGAQDSAPTRVEIMKLLSTGKMPRLSQRRNIFENNGASHQPKLNGSI